MPDEDWLIVEDDDWLIVEDDRSDAPAPVRIRPESPAPPCELEALRPILVCLASRLLVLLIACGYWDPGRNDWRRVRKARQDFNSFKTAIRMHKIDTGRYPRSLDDLTTSQNGKGPWIEEMPADGWGNPYEYEYRSGGKYRVISYGADGEPGGEGRDADLDSDTINDQGKSR